MALGRSTVYVLPNEIPTADMHVWERLAGIVFLRRNKQLTALHESLDCTALSITEVYIKFIFRFVEHALVHAHQVRRLLVAGAT